MGDTKADESISEHTPLLAGGDDVAPGPSRSIASTLSGILGRGVRANAAGPSAALPPASDFSTSSVLPPQPSESGGSEDAASAHGSGGSIDKSGNGKHADDGPAGHTQPSWGAPAGLEPRSASDENVRIFRQAVGINGSTAADAEEAEAGHTAAQRRRLATGIYGRVLRARRTRTLQYNVLSAFVNVCHVVQILVGAALTGLGPASARHSTAITLLGATNTIVAGVFALLKGQGLPDRLHRDAVEFRRVQDWIEQTDALLLSGAVGRDRKEVGILVETAFKKYNAALASEENNKPDNYVRQPPEGAQDGSAANDDAGTGARRRASTDSEQAGNTLVRLDLPNQ